MKKGLEIRLYPTKEQRVLIDRTLGCTRFVYNHILALKKELWEDYKLSFNPNINILNEGLKILSRNTDGRSGRDESLKPVDTVDYNSLEQEPVIVCSKTTSHAGKSSALAEF